MNCEAIREERSLRRRGEEEKNIIQKDKIIKDKRVDGDEDFLRLGRRQ